jgi:hypothetical protein
MTTNTNQTGTPTPVTAPADPLVGKPTSQESSLSSWAGPYVTDMLGRGQALANQPYQAYTGPLTAGPSALQNQAFSGLAGLSMQGYDDAQNLANTAGTAAGNLSYDPMTFANQFNAPGAYTPGQFGAGTFDNAAAQQYMNPYLMSALNPQLDEARRQSEITRLGDATRLTQAGAFGGSRQAIMESELNRNLMNKQSDITGTGYRDAFDKAMAQFNAEQNRGLDVQRETEKSRQFGADYGMKSAENTARYGLDADKLSQDESQFGANFGRNAIDTQLRAAQLLADTTNLSNRGEMDYLRELLAGGATQRGIEQQGIEADKAQFDEERLYPYKNVTFMQSLLEGLPIENRTTEYQQPSTLSEVGSTIGMISELRKLLGI